MNIQQSVVLVKPDGIQRGLVGEIIGRFERKGLKLVGLKLVRLSDEQLETWYEHHKDKPFFPKLRSYMQLTPVVAMLWEGVECIDAVRKLVGITKAREAEAGSIRGDLGMSQQMNLIHASSNNEDAQREIGIIFNADELFSYHSVLEAVVYAEGEAE